MNESIERAVAFERVHAKVDKLCFAFPDDVHAQQLACLALEDKLNEAGPSTPPAIC